MTAQTVDTTPSTPVRAVAPIAWKYPIVYSILALVSFVFFGLIGRDGETTFRVATDGDFFAIPDLVVSSTVAGLILGILLVVMAVVSVFAAVRRISLASWLPILFVALFGVSFLAWAAGCSGGAIPMTT